MNLLPKLRGFLFYVYNCSFFLCYLCVLVDKCELNEGGFDPSDVVEVDVLVPDHCVAGAAAAFGVVVVGGGGWRGDGACWDELDTHAGAKFAFERGVRQVVLRGDAVDEVVRGRGDCVFVYYNRIVVAKSGDGAVGEVA